MTAHLAQWLSLALRWAHVIVGVSWIGTSFYFNWLNARIAPPATPEPGVSGELWSVHGGGFYRVLKYGVAPDRLPATLHWFKWEAYATWWTGLSLLVLLYYVGAREYLLDSAVSTLTPAVGIATGVATLVIAWLVYDALCRSPLGARPAAFAVLGLLLVTALAWGLSHLFSARAAYLHVGAALGTIMAANVFRVIIPSQRAMVASLLAGQAPDARRGSQAALRSLHNNYLTLPVLFVMVSSHYPATYGSRWGWAILGVLFVIGVVVRHWFNLRNAGRRNGWLLPAAVAGLVVLAVATAPRGGGAGPTSGPAASFAEVRVVIAQRCASCHSRAPTYPGIPAAPAGVMFDTPAEIQAKAQRILDRAVTTKTMPLGNLTGITDAERDVLRRWVSAGAPLR
ncbi:MAG TPA: urate hydroxylase PuuD [Gemmatimonadales bacterium]|nr:urate hydroxylase PuuD [Gemmatimonadales bacterium]